MTTPHGPRPGEPHPYPQAPAEVRRNRTWPWVVVSAAVAVVMLGAMVLAAARIGNSGPGAVAAPAAPASAARTTAPRVPPLTVPDVRGMTGDAAVAALAAAGFTNVRFEQNGAPPTAPVITQEPLPGRKMVGNGLVTLVAEPPPPPPHRGLSGREWLLVAKAPDAHVGERITVYGHVTQFDAATGPAGFRANVDGVRHGRTYEYETNTVLRGTAEQLADVVQGDVFRADVTVTGSYAYQTTLGGTLTVPLLEIDAITVVG